VFNVHYSDLPAVLSQIKLPVFGALLDGENIYNTNFGPKGLSYWVMKVTA